MGYKNHGTCSRYHHYFGELSENFNKMPAVALVKYCDDTSHNGLYTAVPSIPHMKNMR